MAKKNYEEPLFRLSAYETEKLMANGSYTGNLGLGDEWSEEDGEDGDIIE